MPGRLTSRLLWIVFGVTILALAYQFEDRLEMVFTTRGELSVEAQPGRVVLRWRGGIEAPMYARLEEAFRKHSQDTPRFVCCAKNRWMHHLMCSNNFDLSWFWDFDRQLRHQMMKRLTHGTGIDRASASQREQGGVGRADAPVLYLQL